MLLLADSSSVCLMSQIRWQTCFGKRFRGERCVTIYMIDCVLMWQLRCLTRNPYFLNSEEKYSEEGQMIALRKGSWQPVWGGLKLPDTKTMQVLTRHIKKYLAWRIVRLVLAKLFPLEASAWVSGKTLSDLQREDGGVFVCLFGCFCLIFLGS